ncbi:MAG: hypothetical protein BMS9Abin36_0053 [Gammaproteobacteria bacterium]|nr:MAG: hypothetical protein BMS9Abin36_0053 [Gammaproteobacteria bacterium]
MRTQNPTTPNGDIHATDQRTLLLVDDEDNVLSALQRLLVRSGYRVLTANSGPAGLTLLEQHDVGVIISDQRMPGMTGVEFLSQVKQRYPEIVRLMLSGFADLKAVTAAINEGAIYRFLTKPCDNELLRSNIEEAFRHFEIRRENERLRQELLASNRALADALNATEHKEQANAEYVATMSHALRTPLNGVLGMAELLRETTLEAQQQDYLETIASSGHQLLTLINDMLDDSKAEAGKLTLESIDFDLQDLIEGLEQPLGIQARHKGLAFVTQFKSRTPLIVRGNPTRLRQALMILLSNAIKFTPAGEVLLNVLPVETADDEVRLLFEVDDTGVGMDTATQHSLLDYFTQAESTTHVYGGDGQGLSICKQLVMAMDGEIGLSSAPGRGSTFWFNIRLAKSGSRQDTSPAMAIRGHKQVLLVEDDPIDQAVASGLLRANDLEVETVCNGQQAVEACSSNHYDLVFMCCRMPVMDGYEATQHIRTQEAQRTTGQVGHTPIIALTANAMSGDRERCLQAGMDDYVIKPINRQVLQTVIDQWLPGRNKQVLTLVPTPPGHSSRQAPQR